MLRVICMCCRVVCCWLFFSAPTANFRFHFAPDVKALTKGAKWNLKFAVGGIRRMEVLMLDFDCLRY
jgi:hypothetical protein